MGFFSRLFATPKKEEKKEEFICQFPISSNVIPSPPGYDQLDVNEKKFFSEFEQALTVAGIFPSSVKLIRLSSGMFNIEHHSGYIGKIKVRENAESVFYMQYFGPRGAIKEIQTQSLQECIDAIPFWVQYIQRCIRARKRALKV